MKTDRLSAWLDDELDHAELEALLSEFSVKENKGQFFVYSAIRQSMRVNSEEDSTMQIASMNQLFERLEDEPAHKERLSDRLRSFFNVDSIFSSLQQNWMPLVAATAIVFGIVLYPVQDDSSSTAQQVLIYQAPLGSAVRVSMPATELDAATDGLFNYYVCAHEGVSAIAVPHSGGLASLRTIVHSDDLWQRQ